MSQKACTNRLPHGKASVLEGPGVVGVIADISCSKTLQGRALGDRRHMDVPRAYLVPQVLCHVQPKFMGACIEVAVPRHNVAR